MIKHSFHQLHRRKHVIFIVALIVLIFSGFPIHRSSAYLSGRTVNTANFSVTDAAYTQSSFPDIPTGGQQNYYLGQDLLNGANNKGVTRLYIKFNFGSNSLPAGSTVTKALVHLYQYSRSCALNSTFSYKIYPPTSAWSGSTMTSNHSPSLGTLLGSGSFTCVSSSWKTITITSLAQSWFAGSANYGVSFRGNPESAAGVVFRSHACSTAQCPGQEHPYLSIEYTINNPVPVITSLDPSSITAGGAAFTLSILGSNFVNGATVQWNGSARTTTFVDSAHLTAAITAADIATGGAATISVMNPVPGGGTSNTQTFTINNPVPAITSLNPSSIPSGGVAFTLSVLGSNFVNGATVQWNGSARTTTFVDSAHLTAAITAADIATGGAATISVINPVPGGGTSNTRPFTITSGSWTFMLYLAGDNNLYSELARAVSSLENQPANPNVKIVVLFDGDRINDTWRFLVKPGGNYTLNVDKWALGELDMGDPQTLSDFVTWARQAYPAQNYYLSIADHGRGTSGVAWDTSSNNDYLSTAELRSALNLATNSGLWKIDVLHYDACLMGMLENAYQVRDYVDYLVDSENLGWSVFAYSNYTRANSSDPMANTTPFEYAQVAAQVTANTTPRQLAINIADTYFNHPSLQGYPRTIAALDLSHSLAVRQAVDGLAATLSANLTGAKTYIQNTRSATQKFDSRDYYHITQDDEYVDLYNLAERLKQYVPVPAVQTAAQSVMDAITNGFVITEHHESGHWFDTQDEYWDLDNAHGVSLYFPPRSGTNDYNAYIGHQKFQFTIDSQWDNFLSDYFGALGLPPDPDDGSDVPPMLPTMQSIYLPIIIR